MTARKNTTIPPKAEDKPEDLTRCSLGGRMSATFYTRAELSPRRARELDVYEFYLIPKLRALAVAQTITIEGEVVADSEVLDGVPVGLTKEEARDIFEMNDTAAWVYLKSWTLKRSGQPAPLPASVDELLDLPPAIYQALVKHAAKIMIAVTKEPQSGFTVDNVEDPDSPTGAFDD